MDILYFLFNLISLLKLNFFPLFFGISIIEVLFELLKELSFCFIYFYYNNYIIYIKFIFFNIDKLYFNIYIFSER